MTTTGDHVFTAYEALRHLLLKDDIGSFIEYSPLGMEYLAINLPAECIVHAHHPDVVTEGDEGWLVEYGHAYEASLRMPLHGRKGISFADLVELIKIGIRLTELRAFPEES